MAGGGVSEIVFTALVTIPLTAAGTYAIQSKIERKRNLKSNADDFKKDLKALCDMSIEYFTRQYKIEDLGPDEALIMSNAKRLRNKLDDMMVERNKVYFSKFIELLTELDEAIMTPPFRERDGEALDPACGVVNNIREVEAKFRREIRQYVKFYT